MIQLLNEQVFYVRYHEETLIQVADFKETKDCYLKLSQGTPIKFMVEFPEFVSATADARKWAEKNQVDCLAEAIVFKSLAQRILIRFYLLWRQQQHPVKIFTDKEKALNWLLNNSF